MTVYVGLLRAVNVGGSGKLPMTALKQVCEAAGFASVRTYIASGNVVFESGLDEASVRSRLMRGLQTAAGWPIPAIVRPREELAQVLAANPFAQAPRNLTVVIFLDAPPPANALDRITGRRDEDVRLGAREIYVFYPGGQGDSRLKIPAAAAGTARNINTVAKLNEIAAAL
jgi:uncharacterized protein (DUF1697 family)